MAEIYQGSTKMMARRVSSLTSTFASAGSHTYFNKKKPRWGGGRRKEKEKGNEQGFSTALRATEG